MNPFESLKSQFRIANTLTRLIYINVAVFILLKLVGVFLFLLNRKDFDGVIMAYLAVPADLTVLLTRPWTLFSYMFLHYDLLHILFNMLWLFWFGKIFLEYLDARKLTAVYLIGGLAGAFLYILSFNVFPVFSETMGNSVALGASAAVLAVVMTISFYAPNYRIQLIFIGPVKIQYIALASVVIDILSIKSGNAGGHIAHLGGAMFGYLYAIQLRRGKDLGRGFNRVMDQIVTWFKPRPKMKVHYGKGPGKPETDYEYRERKAAEQAEIDRILDKISRSGYEALTKDEKARLFSSSKK